MKKSTIMSAVLAVSGASGLALASDFSAEFVGRIGVAEAVTIDGDIYAAGQWGFDYTSARPADTAGQFSGDRFYTFCIELQDIASGSEDYDLGEISDAPNPVSSNGGVPYGEADMQEVNAVVAAAIRLDWINNDLSREVGTSPEQLAAIQGAIWAVLFDGMTVAGIGDVATWMDTLMTEAATDPTASVSGMLAMSSAGSQDQLFIVPLPPAAFAGLLTLGGIAAASRIRRNRA